jgi:hypothetical protein
LERKALLALMPRAHGVGGDGAAVLDVLDSAQRDTFADEIAPHDALATRVDAASMSSAGACLLMVCAYARVR